MSFPSWQNYLSTLLSYSFSNLQMLKSHGIFLLGLFYSQEHKGIMVNSLTSRNIQSLKNRPLKSGHQVFASLHHKGASFKFREKVPSFHFSVLNQNERLSCLFLSATSRQLTLGTSLTELLELTTCSNPYATCLQVLIKRVCMVMKRESADRD